MRRVVVVTGGRAWRDRGIIEAALADLAAEARVVVVHGGASGADRIAGEVAAARCWPVVVVPYFRWLGTRGGPTRNAFMLRVAKALAVDAEAELVVAAFPGEASRGTWHMVRLAREKGVRVDVHGPWAVEPSGNPGYFTQPSGAPGRPR